MRKKLIRFDWAVKKLLRNKANFVVLEGFLSELLFEDIHIEQILESELNQETDEDKYNRVDILCKNAKGEFVIIEVQNYYELDYFHRMVYAASKVIAENISLGQAYSSVKKVISINIVFFDLGQGSDYIYKGNTIFTGMHKHDTLGLSADQQAVFKKDTVAQLFPEYYILKVNNFNGDAKDTLDEWVYFLKNGEIMDSFSAKGLVEAQRVLDVMWLPKEELYIYNSYLENLTYKASMMFTEKYMTEQRALKAEREKGYNERNDEIAEKMVLKGMDNEIIADITQLADWQINEIRDRLTKK